MLKCTGILKRIIKLLREHQSLSGVSEKLMRKILNRTTQWKLSSFLSREKNPVRCHCSIFTAIIILIYDLNRKSQFSFDRMRIYTRENYFITFHVARNYIYRVKNYVASNQGKKHVAINQPEARVTRTISEWLRRFCGNYRRPKKVSSCVRLEIIL